MFRPAYWAAALGGPTTGVPAAVPFLEVSGSSGRLLRVDVERALSCMGSCGLRVFILGPVVGLRMP